MKRPLRKYEGSLPYFLGCIGVAVVLCAAITFFALNYLVLVLENELSHDYERQLRNMNIPRSIEPGVRRMRSTIPF